MLYRGRLRAPVLETETQILDRQLADLADPRLFLFGPGLNLGVGGAYGLQHRRTDPFDLAVPVAQHAGPGTGIGDFGDIDAPCRQIKLDALERHFVDLKALAQIDLIAHLVDDDWLDQLAIHLADMHLQLAYLARHRRQRGFILPTQQAIAQDQFAQRPGKGLAGFGFRLRVDRCRLGHLVEQAQHIEFAPLVHRQADHQAVQTNPFDGSRPVKRIDAVQLDIKALPVDQRRAIALRHGQAGNMGSANHCHRIDLIGNFLEHGLHFGIQRPGLEAERQ